jgi:hypothetical protein
MSTCFRLRSVSEVESEGKKTYYGNSQYRKKEKVFNIGLYNPLIIILYILGLGAKMKEKIF